MPPIAAALLSTCLAISRSDVTAALAAYDRQIATLRALVVEPGLESTRRDTNGSATLARNASAHAAAGVAALARTAAPPALVDPVNVESALQSSYTRQVFAVRSEAQREDDAYGQALATEVSDQASALQDALAHRVGDAYAARVQLYNERENDAYVARESAVAGRELQLRVRLDALPPSATERDPLAAQLAAIGHSLAASAAADRARDAVALAAYRRSLEAAASSEYNTTIADVRRKAATNLALRHAVTSAQQNVTPSLAIDFDAPLRATMATGASSMLSLEASQTTTAQQMETDFTASGNDIAHRFSFVAAADAANTASVRAQLAQMQRARAALATAAATNSCASH
jgi:hypothetical protein